MARTKEAGQVATTSSSRKRKAPTPARAPGAAGSSAAAPRRLSIPVEESDDDDDEFTKAAEAGWIPPAFVAVVQNARAARDAAKERMEQAQEAHRAAVQQQEQARRELERVREELQLGRQQLDLARTAHKAELDATLPALCMVCAEQPADHWCTRTPGAGAPAHGYCDGCTTDLVKQWVDDDAKWDQAPWGASCIGCFTNPLDPRGVEQVMCVHRDHEFANLHKHLPAEAFARYCASKGKAAQRQAQRVDDAARARADVLASLDADLEDASKLRCPNCHRAGALASGCLCIHCPCGHDYCGWCFEWHTPTRYDTTTAHDHVRGCAQNQLRARFGRDSFFNDDPVLYREHCEAKQRELLASRRDRLRDILDAADIVPMMAAP